MHQASGTPFDRTVSDRERVFRAAARHSRWVRFYRRAIPVSLVLVLATVAALAYFKPLQKLANLPIDPSRLSLSGTKDLGNPGVLELKDVSAKVETQDKATVTLQAATGIYDTKVDTLMLKTD